MKYFLHSQKIDCFLKEFKKLYPNFKILKFTDLSSEMIIENEHGIIFFRNIAKRFLTKPIINSFKHINSAQNKEAFANYLIRQKYPNLTVLKYYNSSKIRVQDENNFIYEVGYDLLKGANVSIVNCLEKEKFILFKLNTKHNNFYSYTPFKYNNAKQKMEIQCPIHGTFFQKLHYHLSGSGCPKCTRGGWNKKSWVNRIKKSKVSFYCIKCFNQSEIFLKVGITSRKISERFSDFDTYNFDILFTYENSPESIYDFEKFILKKYKCFRYNPKLKFKGATECLTIETLESLKNEVKKVVLF